MRCLDAGELSRAATGEDHDPPHVAACAACGERVARERALHAQLRALPLPALSNARRAELRAELLATAARASVRRPGVPRVASAAAALVGVAAAFAIVLMWRDAPSSSSPPAVPPVPVAIAPREAAPREAPPPPPIAARELPVPPRELAPKPPAPRRDVRATPRPVPRAERPDTAPRDAMAQFREGWLALRAGRHRDAIAHFDRVIDPVAREEALYWAVVAAHRTGDAALAGERLAMFRAAFPKSDYLAQFDRAR